MVDLITLLGDIILALKCHYIKIVGCSLLALALSGICQSCSFHRHRTGNCESPLSLAVVPENIIVSFNPCFTDSYKSEVIQNSKIAFSHLAGQIQPAGPAFPLR